MHVSLVSCHTFLFTSRFILPQKVGQDIPVLIFASPLDSVQRYFGRSIVGWYNSTNPEYAVLYSI